MLADSITYRALFSVFAGVLLGFSFATLWLSDNPQAMQALIEFGGCRDPRPHQHGRRGRHRRRLGDHRARRADRRGDRVTRRTLRRCHRRHRIDPRRPAHPRGRAARRRLLGLGDPAQRAARDRDRRGLPASRPSRRSSARRSSSGCAIGSASRWASSPSIATWTVALAVVFILDGALIVLLFVSLSGVKARPRTLIAGALIGGDRVDGAAAALGTLRPRRGGQSAPRLVRVAHRAAASGSTWPRRSC